MAETIHFYPTIIQGLSQWVTMCGIKGDGKTSPIVRCALAPEKVTCEPCKAAELERNGYPCSPRKLKDGGWYYEHRKGVTVVIRGAQETISWQRIEAALRHRQAAQKRKK